jgi:choice-of-anchor A domain-containing protein
LLLGFSATRAEATSFLYGASQYGVFVQQSFTMSGSDSKGAVAAGTIMTLSANGVSVASGYTGTPAWSVVAGTSLNCPNTCTADGNIWTSSETGVIYDNYSGGTNHSTGGTDPIDFSNNFTQLQSLSTSLTGMATTSGDGCVLNYSTITCTATKAGMNVIDIPATGGTGVVTSAMLGQAGIGLVFNINAGYLVVNVAGGSLALSSGSFTTSDVTKLLLNYSSSTTALTLGGTVDASVLAPWAVVTAPNANGQFTGNLIAQSYSGGGLEFEGELFNELPEPGTFAMLGGGALLLWAAQRRARR